MNLFDVLAEGGDRSVEVWGAGHFEHHTWGEISDGAARVAAALRSAGLEAGASVACVIANSAAAITGVLGVWWAGGVVCSLPRRARGVSEPAYAALLRGLARHADARLLLTSENLTATLRHADLGRTKLLSWESLRAAPASTPRFLTEDSTAFVQYSSGTTAQPRGCMLTPRAIACQLDALGGAMGIDPDRDRVCSWLPLSHDMGFVGGLLTPWTYGLPLRLGTPERFLAAPASWMQDCASSGATLTVAPSFGLPVAGRAARTRPPSGQLALRSVVVGAERVAWRAVHTAVDALRPWGLALEAITPAYGLAEATLAVTMTRPGCGPRALAVDASRLARGYLAKTPGDHRFETPIVSLGPPLPGVEVDIDGGELGEVVVRTESLAQGYVGDPELSGRRFTSRGLRTGDIGFVDAGELFVVGRCDDIISVAGRNVFAGEVEAECERRTALPDGSCVVVEVPSSAGTRVVLLAEADLSESSRQGLPRVLRDIALGTAGLPIHECRFVERGTLPRTPSGKLQRFRCRAVAANVCSHSEWGSLSSDGWSR